MTPAEQIKSKAIELEQLLLSSSPKMPVLLREIHTAIKADPELVTLLDEEDIHRVVQGLMKQTQTEIASTVMKSKKVSTKNITVDML